MSQVLIIGGGVMGCASALELAKLGVAVEVLERSVPGAEASSAAAGILGAQAEAHHDGPLARLCLASRACWPALAEELRERTRLDIGFRRCGVVHATFSAVDLDAAWDALRWQRDAGLSLERLDAAAARQAEPALAATIAGAVRFADDARVDPPLLLRALRIAAERAGARFRTGSLVRRIAVEAGRARGVWLEEGTLLEAEHVVLAAGSWSGLVAGAPLAADTVKPARGQMVELSTAAPLVEAVIYGPRCYLSPRDDGRVLVGSTLEFVGFTPGVTAAAVRDLLAGAIELVPALGEAAMGRSWSSFRPHTRDELPLVGRSAVDGLLLATGHFRNGILLAPITARIVAALVTGTAPPVDLHAFQHDRATIRG
jgi:glycine oxidase